MALFTHGPPWGKESVLIAIYLLAAIIGLPLVAYSVFSGDGDGGDTGDALDLEDGGFLAYFSLGTFAFLSGFFGLTGLVTTAVGGRALTSFVLAAVVGLLAAITQRSLLSYVRQTSTSSHRKDDDFSGRAATVTVPIDTGQRGRIKLVAGGGQQYFTAELSPGEDGVIDTGAPVVIIGLEHGVAKVARLDPELA